MSRDTSALTTIDPWFPCTNGHDPSIFGQQYVEIVNGLASGTCVTQPVVSCRVLDPTVSGLGAFNIALYAGLYTPLKAVTAFNT